jgi:hypothetical protein
LTHPKFSETPLTLEEAKDVWGTLPKEVEDDSYYQSAFLEYADAIRKDKGEEWLKKYYWMHKADFGAIFAPYYNS